MVNPLVVGDLPLGLYIHTPWCTSKCPYCDFFSVATKDAIPQDRLVVALLRQLEDQRHLLGGRAIASIFIGGGTPNRLAPGTIARLLDGIADLAPVESDCEITMEANPGGHEPLPGYRQAGINRLSIGVQSLHDHLLLAIGREHDSIDVRRTLDSARSAGFASINIDLMHGLPHQCLEQALVDVEQALDLGCDHLSCYALTIEPGTAFGQRPPARCDDDTVAAMAEGIAALLARHGFEHYEVSAFARPGHACRHNLNYWTFGDYLGLGPSAHSKITRLDDRGQPTIWRGRMAPAIMPYINGQLQPRWHQVSSNALLLEFLLNALRLRAGFTTALFQQRTGLPAELLEEGLLHNMQRGLMLREAERIRTTARGWHMLNETLLAFVPGDMAHA
jgi:oxygen-independent coproporphyrinogen-3 oxidase